MASWYIEGLGLLSFLSAFLIIFLVTIRSILELLHLYGFLPPRLERIFVSREERLVHKVFTKLGVYPLVPEIKEHLLYRSIQKTELSSKYEELAKDLVVQSLKKGDFEIGRIVRLSTHYYVSLRERLVERKNSEIVGQLIVAFLKDEIQKRKGADEDDSIHFKFIVGHRDGSPLLAATVADLLGCPCVLYGERRFVHSESSNDDFILEGAGLEHDSYAILIDDSTTDGSMLISMRHALEKRGVKVAHAFVVFNRKSGGAMEALESVGVKLHSILEFTDDQLTTLYDTKS